MSAQKNWLEDLSEIENCLHSSKDFDVRSLLDRFKSIDEKFADEIGNQNFSHLYLNFWKLAHTVGNLNLANKYAKKSLDYLIALKRIPKIKELLNELHQVGLFKKNYRDYSRKYELLLGEKVHFQSEDLKNFTLMDDHPEHWRDFKEFMKQYLLLGNDWSIEEWKYCYEYILVNHFDKDIAYALMEKACELGHPEVVKKFEQLLISKKINFKKLSSPQLLKNQTSDEKLNLDYDQVAMEVLSGQKEPNDDEQTRVLGSLKFIPDEELRTRGKDMIIAFELLGMEKVVLALCEEVIKRTDDIKVRASVYYLWSHALYSNGDHFKAIDLIDELLATEPFYEEERVAFLYLKAEACLKVKKIKQAKEIFSKIKKINPHYRLVGERLRTLETT